MPTYNLFTHVGLKEQRQSGHFKKKSLKAIVLCHGLNEKRCATAINEKRCAETGGAQN